MIEKLLENWLDSASERSYQPVFVQMLSAQGYRVVHSTRHQALEFGKDVLAIAPDGKGCAYQLKGNPGGKLGLNQFRNDIQPQLVQLMSQAVVFPGFPSEPHRAYLVSNGYFEEEVQIAVQSLNQMPYPSKVSLVSRGDLLGWCQELGASLWPSELDDTRLLLDLYLSDAKDVLPAGKLARLISKVLALGPLQPTLTGQPEFQRVVTSAALLTGIATSSFAEAQNHFAVVSAWTVFAVSVIAAGEKHGFNLTGAALETLQLAEAAAYDALVQLWNEVKERKHLVEGHALTDPEIYGWRCTILMGLLSCLALRDELGQDPLLNTDSRTALKQWLQQHTNVQLWSEGAVASLVPWLVWMRKHDSTVRPDYEIAALAKAVISRNQPKSTSALPGPHYSFEDVTRFNMNLGKAGEANALGRETFAGSAFTAEPLFHLLVRTNLKQECKGIWPHFTKLSHRACIPDNPWEYCVLHIASGIDQTRIYPSTYRWDTLKAEAIQPVSGLLPAELAARPCLLALWWQVAPHRYTAAANRVFVESVLPGWGTW